MSYGFQIKTLPASQHLTVLNRAEAAGQIERPFFADPSLELLVQLGLAHDWCLKLGVADCVLKIAWPQALSIVCIY